LNVAIGALAVVVIASGVYPGLFANFAETSTLIQAAP
jgi:hypothetical protein